MIAKNGWQTNDEYLAILSHPIRPDVLVLSYHINDIFGAADERGYPVPDLITYPSYPLRTLVDGSYVINFFYWRDGTAFPEKI